MFKLNEDAEAELTSHQVRQLRPMEFKKCMSSGDLWEDLMKRGLFLSAARYCRLQITFQTVIIVSEA